MLDRPVHDRQFLVARRERLLAPVAQPAGQALREDAVERGADEERFDAHLDQAGDRRRRVVGVQGREHEVPGERGLDAELRGGAVADLADQHDVGVGAQDRRQDRREVEAGLVVDLHLVDAREPVLDRVLDGDDVDLGLADLGERRVQRRRLARPGRAR